jgi:hypothetical protein
MFFTPWGPKRCFYWEEPKNAPNFFDDGPINMAHSQTPKKKEKKL